jgi:hypothetical protein
MLEHLGEKAAADRLMQAIQRVTTNPSLHTADLGGTATTRAVTDAAIAAKISSLPGCSSGGVLPWIGEIAIAGKGKHRLCGHGRLSFASALTILAVSGSRSWDVVRTSGREARPNAFFVLKSTK